MLLTTALTLLVSTVDPSASALTASDGLPVEGAAQRELLEKAVRSDVSSLVVEEATEQAPSSQVLLAAESTEDIGFFGKYFPFGLDEELHPDLDKNLVVVWILMAMFGSYAGPLWIPKVLTSLQTDEEYTTEALINWLIHGAMYVVSFPFIYCFGLGLVFMAVNAFYLFPVATINSFNRHIEDDGGSRKKKGGRSAKLELPGMPTLAGDLSGVAVAY